MLEQHVAGAESTHEQSTKVSKRRREPISLFEGEGAAHGCRFLPQAPVEGALHFALLEQPLETLLEAPGQDEEAIQAAQVARAHGSVRHITPEKEVRSITSRDDGVGHGLDRGCLNGQNRDPSHGQQPAGPFTATRLTYRFT